MSSRPDFTGTFALYLRLLNDETVEDDGAYVEGDAGLVIVLVFFLLMYKFMWNSTTINNPIGIDTLIPARRKGVDGFSVETPGLMTDPVPNFQSSDSLKNACSPTVHKLCHNQAFCGICDA
ncbi:hypothetical protein AVEN_95615-1 [Araneus ventricosus]|uniref:Uncharacterized protein n=1 Tax=Araneus ventricosus TaxID=182803 RepID=A0A4Y2IKU8_ARAVE|nr:hypothetical protein AVEN_95615-1 [Araneus ventricosus]